MRKGLEYREAESVASARKSRCSLFVACIRVPETNVPFARENLVAFFFYDGFCDVLPRSDVKQENKLFSTSNLYGVCKYSSANPIESDHPPPLPLLYVTLGFTKKQRNDIYSFVAQVNRFEVDSSRVPEI